MSADGIDGPETLLAFYIKKMRKALPEHNSWGYDQRILTRHSPIHDSDE